MAQNIFAREESIEPSGGKLKKKKKKKISPYKKKEESLELGGGEESHQILQEDDFNPYNLDDPLDSNTPDPAPKSKPRRRKK